MLYEIKPLSPDDTAYIEDKLGEYCYAAAPPEPGTPQEEQLVFKAEDNEGNLIGGCIVNIHTWGRAVLACLWVDERYRGQGLGSMLIRRTERAVKEKGCHILCLGTIDFQARPLYEKHGFTVFTTTENCPRGHRSWSLSKRLDRDAPVYIPNNNSAEQRYEIISGTKEDAKVISGGLDRYCEAIAPDVLEGTDLGKKLVGEDGRLIAGAAADVGGWEECDLDCIWVEEAYRNRGLGSYLLSEIEREAKENGAYIVLTSAGDWNVGFFLKNGYTVRGELENYPKGHRSYELQKLL